jgi:type II secretory pathway component GspD/PulD (secretin)
VKAVVKAGILIWMALWSALPAEAQDTSRVRERSDSVSVRLIDTDLRAVIQALSKYLPKPVLTGTIPGIRVSVETPAPVQRAEVAGLLRGLIEAQNLEFLEDAAFIRIGPKPPAPMQAQTVASSSGGGGGGAGTSQELFVIRLKHARAADVAATVNLLFGGSGAFSGSSGLSSGTLSDELRRNIVPPQQADPQNGSGTGSAPRLSGTLLGAVTVVPDQLTNSLLIRASRDDFATLNQLDIRPLQVLIEVLIVEARHDRNFSLGADLFLPRQSIGGDQTIEGRTFGGGIGDLVLTLMNLGKANIDAVLRTSQLKGDVEIISRPVLLASNNSEARFLVGSQRPFVQVSRSLPTDTPTRDQVVQYKDVGTKLTVRPTINQDGYVSLSVQQEINAATNETQFDAPVISTREASTQVLVKDGQTIVIGGLRDQQKDRVRSGVPLLSGLPIVGGIFGSTSDRKTQTELYLFLTPRIIRTDADADSLTAPKLERLGQ